VTPIESIPVSYDARELTTWLDALRLVRLVRANPLSDGEQRAQAVRASWAAARNLERARGRTGEARDHHYRIARQRVAQTATVYRAARGRAEIDSEAAREIERIADDIAARLTSLAHAA